LNNGGEKSKKFHDLASKAVKKRIRRGALQERWGKFGLVEEMVVISFSKKTRTEPLELEV